MEYFRKAGHECGMDKKEHILVNLGPLEHEIRQNSMEI